MRIAAFYLTWLVVSVNQVLIAQESAFPVIPGATGYGMYTPAGRGGQILRVTNLNDRGPGSLRAAVETPGPRTIIFEISGTIDLGFPLEIQQPYLTLAGQTAPSPGILIRGSVWVKTHDVLLQHLSIRPGTDASYSDALSIGIEGGRPYNVVVDHCSFAWGTDELVEVVDGQEELTLSFRHCLFAASIHPGQEEESYGMLMYGAGKVDIQRCYFAHHGQRTPLSSVSELVMVNNLCYNRVQRFVQLESNGPDPSKNMIIGNVFADGPSFRPGAGENVILVDDDGLNPGGEIYLEGNAWQGSVFEDQFDMVTGPFEPFYVDEVPITLSWDLQMIPAEDVPGHILSQAGARPMQRLPLDQEVVEDFREQRGEILSDVPDWPDLPSRRIVWVLPKQPHKDDDENGYTNLEEWLHLLAWQWEHPEPYPYKGNLAGEIELWAPFYGRNIPLPEWESAFSIAGNHRPTFFTISQIRKTSTGAADEFPVPGPFHFMAHYSKQTEADTLFFRRWTLMPAGELQPAGDYILAPSCTGKSLMLKKYPLPADPFPVAKYLDLSAGYTWQVHTGPLPQLPGKYVTFPEAKSGACPQKILQWGPR